MSLSYGLLDWPVREPLRVAQVSQVEDATEQFVFELREVDDGDGTVLVQCTSVALQSR